MSRWVILVSLLCCVPTAPSSGEIRVALVIANGDYAGAPLANPTIDAELVRPALVTMGFDVTIVKNADLHTFALTLEDFYARARGADLALFYFAGHGFALGDGVNTRNYLMSVSADVTSSLDVIVRSGGIDLNEVIESAAEAAKVSLIFVDACRKDSRISRGGGTGRGLARISDETMHSTFVGLSTRIGGLADDGNVGAGSPFAIAFAKYMPTPGLRLDDAFRRVRQAVFEETKGGQRPEGRDDLADPLIVIRLEGGDEQLDLEEGSIDPVVGYLPAFTEGSASELTGLQPFNDELPLTLFATDPLAGTLLQPLSVYPSNEVVLDQSSPLKPLPQYKTLPNGTIVKIR
jgi:uncharacterized caspase-like protein